MNDFYKNKKVLITGNTGFKGTWMSQMLIHLGADVTGIALRPQTEPAIYEILGQDRYIHEHITDIRDFEKVRAVFDETKPDIVFQLAAQPIVIDSYKDPRYTYDVNVMGTVNVCECVRNSDSVRSFVNVTTDKVYRNNEWEFPYREVDFLDGYDPYSNSKSCSELVTASYNRSFFHDKEIPTTTCRAGNVIGGGDFSNHRIIPDCYRNTISGNAIEVRNPHSVRPYQHVLEAIAFYLFVARKQAEDPDYAGSYNVGPEHSDCLKTSELCNLFCDIWGEGAGWKTVGNDGPHEANLLKLDTSRAKTKLGWCPVWDADRTVRETVSWYKTYSNGEKMEKFTEEQIRLYLEEASDWWDS